MGNVKPRFLGDAIFWQFTALAHWSWAASLLARRRHHQGHALFDRQDYVVHPFAQLEANGMPKQRLQKGEDQMRVAPPFHAAK
ncbi:hypothetical protein WK11_25180 [Burkholderia ubonensis]|nr:hypothetical protein WJ69_21830 [Burkholderia ubonensis]KVO11202.1 hypothetical protein WJ73_20045 [Burkholderia ubonensis]KVR17085.1 hypothetical protein WK11_25180 [Burkholderia ubonensis]KVX86086.1 hypothetical protein WL10_22940 [Burkholderia ubonensis]